MRVLMFGWEFPPHNSGGLGVACYGLSKALAQQGVDITFVLPKKVNLESEFLQIVFADVPNIKYEYIDSPLVPYIDHRDYQRLMANNPEQLDLYGASLVEEVTRYGQLAREVAADLDFDLIHSHDWLSALAGINAQAVSKKPLLMHIHATELDRTIGNPDPRIFEIERIGLNGADHVAAVSNLTKGTVVNEYGVHPDQVEVVHNGIEYVRNTHPETLDKIMEFKRAGNKLVLFVGRITVMKGVDYLIQAAEIVLKHDQNAKFAIVGAGDMQGTLMDLVAKKGLSDKILFPGFLRGAEKDSIYQAADLFVMPSVSEPFGLVALEAIINGTPALISKQSGVSEVVPNALKVDFWDVEEMANKILSVLKHGALQSTLVEHGQKDAANMSWENTAGKVKRIYEKLLN